MNAFSVALLGFITLLSPATAGAHCGSTAERTAVQNAAIAKFNAGAKKIDKTYVMAVVVLDKMYGEADISYAGQMSYYLQKKNGAWTVAGTSLPASWPSSVRAKLTKMFNQRAAGSKTCTNPAFVPRGSG